MPLYSYGALWPKLAPNCFIAPNASVIGGVEIGSESSIWFGAVVRGDVYPIRIGRRVNLQDNSVVHVTTGRHMTTIGDGVTIGHRVILHGCTIEAGALIGMGAIVMDRAVIGAQSLVAAGALVTEGTQIPERSLVVGVPARVKRALSEAELGHLADSAGHYTEIAAVYIAKLGAGHCSGEAASPGL